MFGREKSCEACGHRPMKSFTQRLGETVLACMWVGGILLVLFFLQTTGS